METKSEIRDLKEDLGIIKKVECSKEEKKSFKTLRKEGKNIPDDVVVVSNYDGKGDYYRYTLDVTPSEQEEYLLLRQTKLLKTISNCLVYFTVLSIIGVIAYAIILMSN